MTAEQASDIVALLRAATRGQADEGTIAYFEASMLAMDYQPALTAATLGVNISWRVFPSWTEFREAYNAQTRDLEIEAESKRRREDHKRLPEEQFRRGIAAPEWVWVWAWVRGWSPRARDPIETRPFPQQSRFVDATEVMSMTEYENLLAEWVAAGSPKSRNPLPVMS